MKTSQLLTKVRKIAGAKTYLRQSRTALDSDDRIARGAQAIEMAPQVKAKREEVEARRRAVLAADTAYQALRAEYAAINEECESAARDGRNYRWAACKDVSGMFTHVIAQADTAQELIDKLAAGQS